MNTPRRPWEASGTSGMKVLVNGGLNLSEFDGWWAEAYSPEVGWAIGDGREHGDDPSWDAADAERLYAVLEREIIPEFYARDEHGIPRGMGCPHARKYGPLNPGLFEQSRSPAIYRRTLSLGGSSFSPARRESRFSGADLVAWQAELAKHWSALRFGPAAVEQQGERYLFHIQVFLDDIDPDAVRVELYAEAQKDEAPITHAMNRGERLVGATSAFTYSASVPASRPVAVYTPRFVPQHVGAFVPLEAPFILWHEAPSWR